MFYAFSPARTFGDLQFFIVTALHFCLQNNAYCGILIQYENTHTMSRAPVPFCSGTVSAQFKGIVEEKPKGGTPPWQLFP